MSMLPKNIADDLWGNTSVSALSFAAKFNRCFYCRRLVHEICSTAMVESSSSRSCGQRDCNLADCIQIYPREHVAKEGEEEQELQAQSVC